MRLRAYSEVLRGLGECHRQAKNESGSPLPLLAALWKQYSFLMMCVTLRCITITIKDKREREYVENIRIKEYNEIYSEKFRMTIKLWRMREFPFKKIWTFFHE